MIHAAAPAAREPGRRERGQDAARGSTGDGPRCAERAAAGPTPLTAAPRTRRVEVRTPNPAVLLAGRPSRRDGRSPRRFSARSRAARPTRRLGYGTPERGRPRGEERFPHDVAFAHGRAQEPPRQPDPDGRAVAGAPPGRRRKVSRAWDERLRERGAWRSAEHLVAGAAGAGRSRVAARHADRPTSPRPAPTSMPSATSQEPTTSSTLGTGGERRGPHASRSQRRQTRGSIPSSPPALERAASTDAPTPWGATRAAQASTAAARPRSRTGTGVGYSPVRHAAQNPELPAPMASTRPSRER